MRQRLPESTRETSESCNSEQIKKWLWTFGQLTRAVAEPGDAEIWAVALSDLTPQQIDAGFNRLLKTWRYPKMPLPADVRGPIDAAKAETAKADAENAWHTLMRHVAKWCHPDGFIPFGSTPPRLNPRMDHAARAAGGTRFLWNATDDELVWAKKRFLADFERSEMLADAVALLPMGTPKLALVEKPAKQLQAADTPITQADANYIRSELNAMRAQIERWAKPEPQSIEISEQMRQRAEQAAQEALRRFGTGTDGTQCD